MSFTKRPRAEQSRINGAKSRGPKTVEGTVRARSANLKHGLYAADATVLDVESKDAFNIIRDAAMAQFQPRSAFEAHFVEELADISWRIARLMLCATHETNVSVTRLRESAGHPLRWKDAVTKAELDSSVTNGSQQLLLRRIKALIFTRSRVAMDLANLRSIAVSGTSQESLITKDLPETNNPNITQENLNYPENNLNYPENCGETGPAR